MPLPDLSAEASLLAAQTALRELARRTAMGSPPAGVLEEIDALRADNTD